jgi:hypothetical protein
MEKLTVGGEILKSSHFLVNPDRASAFAVTLTE